jgi:hypothetical protein
MGRVRTGIDFGRSALVQAVLKRGLVIARVLPPSVDNRSHSVHPWLQPNLNEPILGSRYSPEIFLYVLLGNIADGHLDSLAVGNRDPEDSFRQEHAFGTVSKCTVPEIGEERFRSSNQLWIGR